MKNKLKSSVFFLCLVIILSGCNKSDSNSVNGSFGFGESENNILDDSVTPDISINSSNKFSIDESNKVAQNILKSEEDIKQEEILEELESIAEESEPYTYVDTSGYEKDIRQEAGYKGILKYIYSRGGVDDVPKFLSEDMLKADLEYLCFYATKEEIDSVIKIIYYGTEDEKKSLNDEIIHTVEPGWYIDENNEWKNVYDVPADSYVNFIE